MYFRSQLMHKKLFWKLLNNPYFGQKRKLLLIVYQQLCLIVVTNIRTLICLRFKKIVYKELEVLGLDFKDTSSSKRIFSYRYDIENQKNESNRKRVTLWKLYLLRDTQLILLDFHSETSSYAQVPVCKRS